MTADGGFQNRVVDSGADAPARHRPYATTGSDSELRLAAVQQLITRYRSADTRSPVVLFDDGDRLAADLSLRGQTIDSYRVGPEPGDSDTRHLDAPRDQELVVIALSKITTVDHPAVRSAYQTLRPGARLVLSVAGAGRSSRTERRQARSPRDLTSTLLFAEGFEQARFHHNHGSDLLVEAIRGKQPPPRERDQVLSVILPAYNECATFGEVMDELVEKVIPGVAIEIIVVESNSTDGTREQVLAFAEHPRVRILLEERPQGKGHAVRTGLAAATGDYVLIQDADLEYHLDDYEQLLEPLQQLQASFVLGARNLTTGARFGVRRFEKQVLISQIMNVGNVAFRAMFNLTYGVRLQDPFTMYKVLRRDCLYRIRLECDRFDFDWELTGKLIRAGYRPVERRVWYRSRGFDEGKKISIFGDPWTWIAACIRYRFVDFEE